MVQVSDNQSPPLEEPQSIVEDGATALAAITRAEIDVQIATAMAYPRKLGAVKRDMLSFATLDEETAAACFYTLPRGGKSIRGPSVRLAEIALSCYGNSRAATRCVAVVSDGPTPHVVVQSAVHDLEKNVAVSIEKRRRITKKKSAERIDEDDINLAVNACSAIAFRDAVFKIVPGALIKPAFDAARGVAIGNAATLVDRRAKALDTFAKMGIPKERVLAAIGKGTVDDVGLADLETLLGTYAMIRDGQANIDDAFPPLESNEPATPTSPLPTGKTDMAGKRRVRKQAEAAPEQAPITEPTAAQVAATLPAGAVPGTKPAEPNPASQPAEDVSGNTPSPAAASEHADPTPPEAAKPDPAPKHAKKEKAPKSDPTVTAEEQAIEKLITTAVDAYGFSRRDQAQAALDKKSQLFHKCPLAGLTMAQIANFTTMAKSKAFSKLEA